MLQFRLQTLLIAVAACCTLAACIRLYDERMPKELRVALPYFGVLLLYGVLALAWSVAYLRAPAAAIALAVVGLSVLFTLSLILCLVVQSRENARRFQDLHNLRELGGRFQTWEQMQHPLPQHVFSGGGWPEYEAYDAYERAESRR